MPFVIHWNVFWTDLEAQKSVCLSFRLIALEPRTNRRRKKRENFHEKLLQIRLHKFSDVGHHYIDKINQKLYIIIL